LWCADVIPFADPSRPGSRTVIRVRTAGDGQWRVIGEIAEPAVDLDNRGSELLVVLAEGEWRIVSTDGTVRSGIPLPQSARVLAVTGDNEDIWAVGAAPAGKLLDAPAAATATATTGARVTTSRSSAATTTAATAAVSAGKPALPPHELALFKLTRGTWTEVGLLPAGLRRDDVVAVSMDVLERRVALAVATRDRAVRVYTRTATAWSDGRDVATLPDAGRMKLTECGGRPILWISEPRGPGAICVGRDGAHWSDPVKLAVVPSLARFDRAALVAAMGRLLLLASDGKGRLAEQPYNLDGSTAGALSEALTAPVALDARIAEAMQLVVMAVLLVWVVGAMRQRPNLQEAVGRIEQLGLAPLGRRFIGGLIDALPVMIGLIVAGELAQSGADSLAGRLTFSSPAVATAAAGIGLYLLHTTVLELLLGRSLGKLLTGTRVAALDGARPAAAAVLIRNLLRIVDLFLVFPPVFVVFSPLRQRVGDMAAGTVVVLKDAPTTTGDADGQED
jgi:uncharacterized RDD family membrane protein YckC